MLKALSNNLAWYNMQWYNVLKTYHKKTTKNHSTKKQGNKDNLVGPFHNQIMNLAILIFGRNLMAFIKLKYLHKTFCGTTKKSENKHLT